jgi:DNA polymerase I
VNLTRTHLDGQEVDVLAYEYESDLAPVIEEITLDVQATQDKVLRNPMEDILDAIGLDVDAAIEGQQQSGIGAFM